MGKYVLYISCWCMCIPKGLLAFTFHLNIGVLRHEGIVEKELGRGGCENLHRLFLLNSYR